jgi:hypothetical protein
MGLQFLRLRGYRFFLLFFLVVSCSSNLELKKPQGETEFSQETSRLEKLAREDPATPVRANSHLRLAFLYVNSRNSQLNYSRALQEMESYLSMSPAKAQKDDFRNWLSALREMDQASKHRIELEKKHQNLRAQSDRLQAALEKAQKANAHLLDEVAALKETNTKMIEIIERLKLLDCQMEEKRSLIK